MSADQRNEDGSFTPIEPLGWQGTGIDWEIYRSEKPLRAMGYDEDVLVGKVTARTAWGLNRKMRRVEKAHDLPRNSTW